MSFANELCWSIVNEIRLDGSATNPTGILVTHRKSLNKPDLLLHSLERILCSEVLKRKRQRVLPPMLKQSSRAPTPFIHESLQMQRLSKSSRNHFRGPFLVVATVIGVIVAMFARGPHRTAQRPCMYCNHAVILGTPISSGFGEFHSP